MAIEFQIDEKSQLVQLVLRNQSTMDEVQSKLPALISIIDRLENPLLLIDYIEDSCQPNPRRRAGLALFAEQLNEHIEKIAINCPSNLRQDVESIKEVMKTRGTQVKMFSDKEEAIHWLNEKKN